MIDQKKKLKPKSVRALERKTNDIESLFQLAEYYEQGKYVDKDLNIANEYYDKALSRFNNQALQLLSVKLIDFRIFNNTELEFCNKYDRHSNLTVVIGNNGAGKTTVLEAIAKSLKWLIITITSHKEGGKGWLVEEADINNENTVEYASIISTFAITKEDKYQIELAKSKIGSKTSISNSIQNIRFLSRIYKYANSKNRKFNFPILAFYSVNRAIDINKKDIAKFDEFTDQKTSEKFDGYVDSLNGSANFKYFFRWFKYLDDLNNAAQKTSKDGSDIARLKEEVINDILLLSSSNTKVDESKLSSIKDKLEEFGERDTEANDLHFSGKIIKCVSEAIYKFIPEFKNLRIQRLPTLDMLIDKNNLTVGILQLSQGEKSLIALIGDIVRRLVLLNPSLDNPLEGSGIILIDEIDLHLHPAWQQTILLNLIDTFPNIQFIVTTHSPQVLSTVHAESIRILSNEIEGDSTVNRAIIPSAESRGISSSSLMAELQGVDPIPNVEEALWLSEYKNLIVQRLHEETRGVDLKEKILKHFGENHYEWRECGRLIRLQIMKDKLPKAKKV